MTLNKILMQLKQQKNKELLCICRVGGRAEDLNISLFFYIRNYKLNYLMLKIFHLYSNENLAPYCDVMQCSDYLVFTGV